MLLCFDLIDRNVLVGGLLFEKESLGFLLALIERRYRMETIPWPKSTLILLYGPNELL